MATTGDFVLTLSVIPLRQHRMDEAQRRVNRQTRLLRVATVTSIVLYLLGAAIGVVGTLADVDIKADA
jgi:hypothetical protein